MTPRIQEYLTLSTDLATPPLCKCDCGLPTNRIAKQGGKYGGGTYRVGQYYEYRSGHHRIRPAVVEAVPFKINGVYCRLIPLTLGQWTIVWEVHYGYLMQWKWHTRKSCGQFYAVRWMICPDGKGRHVSMQNILMPPEPGHTIDHISGCGLDNRYDNFRQATAQQQSRNTGRQNRSASLYKGVRRDKHGEWLGNYWAKIGIKGKYIHSGPFKTEIEAALEYDRLARLHFGEYARLNFPSHLNERENATLGLKSFMPDGF